MEERILFLPDLLDSTEEMLMVEGEQSFHHFFSEYGFGWGNIGELVRSADRWEDELEKIPNKGKERIRQLVANTMIFVIPDDSYDRIKHGTLTGEDFKQDILPHIKLLASKRLPGGAEERLHGKLSSAFGGHVDEDDAKNFFGRPFLDGVIQAATERELLSEELSAKKPRRFEELVGEAVIPFGIINSSVSEMESVHIGFVNVLAVPESVGVKIKETDKLEMVYIPFEKFDPKYESELASEYKLETWTKISFFNVSKDLYLKAIITSILSAKKE